LALVLLCSLSAYSQQIELRGEVRDFDTKEPIAGASISIKQLNKGTSSDDSGRFSIVLPADRYDVICSSSGYNSSSKIIYLLDEHYWTCELKKRPPFELPEVVIESRKTDANIAEVKMSTVNVNIAQLRKTPMVFGEADIIKALTLQSGVTSVGEGANGFNVRGGNVDQNLVLLDGAPIFNTAHLLGFYSVISADAVQNFTLYKGTIPASFGGRLSSLAAINVKPGNEQKIKYNTGISPISAHIFIDGPINDKLTFLGGVRVAYPRVMMSLFPGSVGNSNAFFYDLTGKLNYKINSKNRISLSLYRSYDYFKFPGDTTYGWQTNIVAVNWRSEITKKLVFNFNSNYSYYLSDINGIEPNYQFRLRNTIKHQQAKANFSYQVADNDYLEFGGDFINYVVNPGQLMPTKPSSIINKISLQNENGDEIAGYLLDRFDITSLISFEAGIRHSTFLYRGAHTIYEYQPGLPESQETVSDSTLYGKGKTIQQYSGWEPRVLLKIGIDEATSIKLSYDRTYQYLQLISNTISITPVDYWKLSDPQIKPAIGDQYAAGIFRNFSNNVFETSIEGFYKRSQNLLDYKNGATLSMNPYIDAGLLEANGKSYGLEFNLRKVKGKITGQVAYTWSRSFIADISSFASEQVNGGEYYPSNYDRPSNLSITGGIKLGNGWDFNCNFVYVSGRPSTYPDGTYVINNTVVTNYSLRNEDRLPDYNRLDISFSHDSRRFADQKKYTIINFSLYNVYARKNPYSIYFQRDESALNSYELSVLGTMIPSITLYYFF
jgi:CarboxypepD_reg-like domain/TonB-dependent Receptor Plug Domain